MLFHIQRLEGSWAEVKRPNLYYPEGQLVTRVAHGGFKCGLWKLRYSVSVNYTQISKTK